MTSTVLLRTPAGLWFHAYPLDLVGRTLVGHSATWHPTGRAFWTLDTKPTRAERGEDWVDAPNGSLWDWSLLGPLMDEATKPGALIIDVGANIGTSAVYSGSCGGTVLAVEGYPPTFDLLCRNIAANGLDGKVYPLRFIASDRDGRFKPAREPEAIGYFEEITLGGVEFHRTAGEGAAGGPLDSVVPMYSLGKRVTLIKTDVQGADLLALQGLERTIRAHRPVVCFEAEEVLMVERGESLDDYLDFLKGLDYRVEESCMGNNYVGRPK